MIKLKAKRKDLEKVNNQKKETEQVSRIKRTRPSIKPELDLRGVRYEDAMREIENYLDNAILSGFPQGSIIHEKGTGALRHDATEYVKTHRKVNYDQTGVQNEDGCD